MNFAAHYWPALDEAQVPGVPGSPWLCCQVNQITSAAIHPNGMIDVLGRTFKGNQYTTLLKHPEFPFVAMVCSTDPNHNVPPTTITEATLFEAMGPDGIGEVASGQPFDAQIPPLVILPNNTTPGFVLNGQSWITGQGKPYMFPYTTQVTFKGPWWGWKDCVVVTYFEPLNNRYINYVFAAAEPGKPSGMVLCWSATKDPKTGAVTGELESYAIGSGHI